MSNQRVDGGGNSNRAAEALRRRLGEAVDPRTQETLRRAADVGRQALGRAMADRSQFEDPTPRALLLDATGPATSLLTEDVNDGNVNCLDLAADWLDLTTPELRARSEVVFLQDARGGAEGQSGHVIIRQGERVFDPTTKKSYANTEEYLRANPQYREVGSLPATSAKKILDTPPGSPERQQALAQASVSPELQKMMVADIVNDGGVSQVGPRPLTPASAEAANADFEEMRDSDPTYWSGKVIADLEAHADDPDYQAQYIARLKETVEGQDQTYLFYILNDYEVPGQPRSPFLRDSVTGELHGSEKDRDVLINAFQAAKQAGTLTDADLQAGANLAPNSWGEIASRMGVSLVERKPEADAASTKLEKLRGDYEDKLAAAKKKDEELVKQLAEFGPLLTEEQRQAYVTAYRNDPSNKKAYEKLEKAASELAEHVSDNKATLIHGAATSRADADRLKAALEALGQSPHATVAVEVLGEIVKDPSSLEAQAFSRYGSFAEELLATAAPRVATELLAEGRSREDAMKQFEQLMEPFKVHMELTKGGVDAWSGSTEAYVKAAGGDAAAVEKAIRGGVPLAAAFAGAGLIFGMVGSINAASEGEYDKLFKELAGTGDNGVKFLASMTALMSDVGEAATLSADVSRAARFQDLFTRLSPRLGAMASASSAVIHGKELFSGEGNLGTWMALAGDLVSLTGSALVMTGVGAAWGAGLSGVGAALTSAGEWVSWLIKNHELTQQQRDCLTAVGFDPKVVDYLMLVDEGRIKELANDLRLSPEQLGTIVTKYPVLLNNLVKLERFIDLTRDFNLSPDEVMGLLDKVSEGAGSPEDGEKMMLEFLESLTKRPNFMGVKTQEEWKAALHEFPTGRDASPEAARAFANADAFFATLDRREASPAAFRDVDREQQAAS